LCCDFYWVDDLILFGKMVNNSSYPIEIEKKTFTRWVCAQLRIDSSSINIRTFFEDGTKLIELILKLFPRVTEADTELRYILIPKQRVQKFDNVNLALLILNKAGINVPFVKAEGIVDGEEQMIMSLIWILIWQSEIKEPLLKENEKKKMKDTELISYQDPFSDKMLNTEEDARMALLRWCQERLANYRDNESNPIYPENFSTSFQNGKAIAGLVHSLAPDSFDFRAFIARNSFSILKDSFAIAYQKFGIYALLDAQNVVDDICDERTMIAYIGQFLRYYYSEKPIRELNAEFSGASLADSIKSEKPSGNVDMNSSDILRNAPVPPRNVLPPNVQQPLWMSFPPNAVVYPQSMNIAGPPRVVPFQSPPVYVIAPQAPIFVPPSPMQSSVVYISPNSVYSSNPIQIKTVDGSFMKVQTNGNNNNNNNNNSSDNKSNSSKIDKDSNNVDNKDGKSGDSVDSSSKKKSKSKNKKTYINLEDVQVRTTDPSNAAASSNARKDPLPINSQKILPNITVYSTSGAYPGQQYQLLMPSYKPATVIPLQTSFTMQPQLMSTYPNGTCALPPGWELGRDPQGRPYYIDHNTKSTTYVHPITKQLSLPPGWEMHFDPNGIPYYLDHNKKTTSYQHPCMKSPDPSLSRTPSNPEEFSNQDAANSKQ